MKGSEARGSGVDAARNEKAKPRRAKYVARIFKEKDIEYAKRCTVPKL